jgi:hypothetical protein
MSSTDTALPMRIIPKIEKLQPSAEKDRIDREEPKCKKSSTDIEEPNRAMFRRDIADAQFAKS